MADQDLRQLERVLLDLGPRIDYPPTPDLASLVSSRLAHPRRVRSRRSWWLAQPSHLRTRLWSWSAQPRPALALAILAAVVLAGAVFAVWPAARDAVAERLGLRGVQITQVPNPIQAPPPGGSLNLGEPITLETARSRVTYSILLPQALGAPDAVYLLTSPPGGQVALVYAPRAEVPVAGRTGVGVLLTEFRGGFHGGGPIGKGLPPGTQLEDAVVDGVHGYWIEGDPHVFFFFDAQGRVQTETTRLAANVLLWESRDLTLRLESALTRDAALRIAESIQ